MKNTVGYVTSGWFSPEVQTNIGFAMLPVGMTEFGTKLKVKIPEKYKIDGESVWVDAEVVPTPFKVPDKEERGAGLNRTGYKL